MQSRHRSAQKGFTLIELVVVIVIIGILAAFAIPRFSNIAKDARTSSANGLLGSVRSTAALVHGIALARNTADGATIDLEGAAVEIQKAYPSGEATGIVAALSTTAGYDLTYPSTTSVRFAVVGATAAANCQVTYAEPTAAGLAPTITSDVSNC